MGHIFLSYAREDRACAERLARVLEAEGHEVWWDRRLDGGEEFGAEIEAALDKSGAVVVAWSANSVRSRWVRDEASVGGDRGQLIPVSIDGSLPPMGFRQFHTIDLTGWKAGKRDKRTADFIHAVERRLNGKGDGDHAAPVAVKRPSVGSSTRRLWPVAVALVALILVVGAGYFLVKGRGGTTPPPRLTVALLPFTATTNDAQLHDIAAQSTDVLSRALQESGVTVRTLAAAPKDLREAGDFVVTGDVTKKGEKVVATVRMDQVAHNVTVFTRQFEADAGNLSDLPERVGAQFAGTIAWAAPLIELEIRHPSDPAVTADLVRQLDFLGDPLQGYQAAQRAAARDPKSAFAQVALAFDTAFSLSQIPADERAAAVSTAREAADRAVQLAPEFGDAYSVRCYLQSETLLVDCERRLQKARRIDPSSPFVDSFLSGLLRLVGRYEEAAKLAQLSYTRDPYVPTKIGWMLRTLTFSGNSAEAERLNQQGVRWWPEFASNYFGNRLLPLVQRGDWKGIEKLEKSTPPASRSSDYQESTAILAALKSRSAAAMDEACSSAADDYRLGQRCLVGFAAVGSLDSAFELAAKLYPNRVGRTPAETERIWLQAPETIQPLELLGAPALAPLRTDPRYLDLAQRTGLLAYWRSGRLPDFCKPPKPEPICRQLARR